MVNYECRRCSFKTNQKSIFRRHLLRKNICPLKLEELNKYQLLKIHNFDEEAKQFEHLHQNTQKTHQKTPSIHQNTLLPKKKYICIHCKKEFSRSDSLNRHINNRCKVKNDMFTVLYNKIDMLIKENEELKKQLKKEKSNKNNKHNNNSFNTVKNNKIEINNYGSENIDYITEKVFKRLLNTPLSAIPKLIELKHFHPEHPENHNIKITNIHDKFAKIYKDKKWLVKHKKDVIQELVENGYADFEEFKDLNEDQLAEKIKEKYEIMEKYYSDQEEKLLEKSEISVINGSNKF